MNASEFFSKYWWILLVLILPIFYKFILRVFCRMFIVPENWIGHITKKFMLVGTHEHELLDGRIIATKGEAGFQAKSLAPGLNWKPFLSRYEVAVQIEKTLMTEMPIGSAGVVISYIGEDGKDPKGESFKHKTYCIDTYLLTSTYKKGHACHLLYSNN